MPRYRVDATYRETRVYFVMADSKDAAEEAVLEGQAALFSSHKDQFYVNSVETHGVPGPTLCSVCRETHGLELIHESE